MLLILRVLLILAIMSECHYPFVLRRDLNRARYLITDRRIIIREAGESRTRVRLCGSYGMYRYTDIYPQPALKLLGDGLASLRFDARSPQGEEPLKCRLHAIPRLVAEDVMTLIERACTAH